MSLNKLKDALQDYQNSYSECLGITPTSSTPTQGKAETNSAFPELDFEFNIPASLKTRSTQLTQEKDSSTQTETDEDFSQQKRNQFVDYSENDQSQQENQSIQNRQRRPRTRRKKKEGFNFTPIIIFFVFIMLCSIGYAIYDFSSSKRAPISLSSSNEMSMNHEVQKENTYGLSHRE